MFKEKNTDEIMKMIDEQAEVINSAVENFFLKIMDPLQELIQV